MKNYRARYESELLERVVPFWIEHGIDRECGGYFSVVGRKGELLEGMTWYPHVLPDGTPFMFCKGTMFKGFFHLPRCLMICAQMMPK